MPKRDQGKVADVSSVQVGDEVVQAHASGATVLYLNDVSEFDDDGGQVSIDGVVYTYTTKDDDASTLTLSSGLTAAVADDTQVFVFPLAYEKWATVIVEDGEDAVLARIPMTMENNVIDGVRDESEQESARVVLRGTEWEVTDIDGINAANYVGGGAKKLDDLDDVTVTAGAIKHRQQLAFDLTGDKQWKPMGPVVNEGTALPADPSQYYWQFFLKHI